MAQTLYTHDTLVSVSGHFFAVFFFAVSSPQIFFFAVFAKFFFAEIFFLRRFFAENFFLRRFFAEKFISPFLRQFYFSSPIFFSQPIFVFGVECTPSPND